MPKKAEFVAVYGSLKKNFGNHLVLKNSRFISEGLTETTRYNMVSLGGFPGLLRGQEGAGLPIKVEVYLTLPNVLKTNLDRLEGYPNFYDREQITIDSLDREGEKYKAWIYFLNGDVRGRTLVEPESKEINGMKRLYYNWKGRY